MTFREELLTDSNYKIMDNVVWERVADEMIVFNLNSGRYYRFNHSGLQVWQGLIDALSRQKIILKLQKEFGSDKNIERDVDKFLDELLKEMLINHNE